MELKHTLLLLSIILGVGLQGQTPCEGGMAGIYPCSGYDLLGHLSLAELGIPSDGNDCWGWTDPVTGHEYALMGGSNRTVFVDITDPVNLEFIGFLSTATGTSIWRDMKVYNDHAFIVSEASGHGMQVFDLNRLRNVTSPPENFDADAYFDGFGHAHNIAINEETGYAYPIGTSLFDGGPVFINIQDPLNPVLEGGYDGDGYTHDAQIIVYDGPDVDHQCKEIFFGYNANTLTIVDVTDKSNPLLLSIFDYPSVGYTHQGWLNEERTIVYLNDETDEINFGNNTRTMIIDVSDLDNPVLLEQYLGETEAIDHNLYVDGDKVFEANYNSGMRVLQIGVAPLNRLEEVGFFDVNPITNSAAFNGSWSLYPYFESGNIIISAIDQGFFVVNSSSVVANPVTTDLINCSIGIEEYDSPSFSLYPNPVVATLNLQMEDDMKLKRLVIRDLVGRIIYEENNLNTRDGIHQIDVSSFSPGTYFATINDDVKTQKFIVE